MFRARGFTLIELLLSMMLISLIMVMAYSGLRTSAHAVNRGEQMVERNNRLRVVQSFLRRQIAGALPLTMQSEETLQDDLSIVRFEGDERSMRFVAPMPGYLGHGGPHEQTISFERGDLLFDHQLLNQGDDSDLAAAIDEREPVVLLEAVRDVQFSYLEAAEDDEEPSWVDSWDDPAQTPLMVRVEVEFGPSSRMAWPTLEVAPLIDVAAIRGGGRRGGRQFGDGRSRDDAPVRNRAEQSGARSSDVRNQRGQRDGQ